MVSDVYEIIKKSGAGAYSEKKEKERKLFFPDGSEKAFLIENPHTLELRTDPKLGKLLSEKYESVMQSRYFGKQGIEIVSSADQLSEDELADLVRLSYDLTAPQ